MKNPLLPPRITQISPIPQPRYNSKAKPWRQKRLNKKDIKVPDYTVVFYGQMSKFNEKENVDATAGPQMLVKN